MSGGGKGGSQTQTVEAKIDPKLAKASGYLIDRAKQAAQFGYQPNRNVQVAAFTPMQQAGFQNQANAMNAFGMAAPQDPMAGMPQAQMSGSGIAGYSFAPEYDRAMAMLPEGYRAAIENLFIDPNTGKMQGKAKEGGQRSRAFAGKGGLGEAMQNREMYRPRGMGSK